MKIKLTPIIKMISSSLQSATKMIKLIYTNKGRDEAIYSSTKGSS